MTDATSSASARSTSVGSATPAEGPSTGPAAGGAVLATLIVVAAVANLPLAMANIALPSIGDAFDASQIQLNLVAVGYSLGLACSVLWLGAIGDRYGRKQVAILGVVLAIPAAIVSGLSPTIEILIAGRIFGGFAAGMAYPTTLALIAALWPPGPPRTRAIALWAAIGGAISVSGPLLSGILLEIAAWPAVFIVVVPLALVALVLAVCTIPSHVNEATEPVDHVGGALSVVLVGAFVLAINFIASASMRTEAIALLAIAAVALVLFILRQRRAENPLYDLAIAARPTFWVAAVAGIIVFGSLMGAMFIGQQYLQDVLGFDTIRAALPALFAGACMILAAPRSAAIVEQRGSRFTLLAGYVFVLAGFWTMLLLWGENASFLVVVLAFSLVGIGIGLSGTPASRSLTGSVPVTRVGMASGTADLQRDLGGAIFNSLFGALLAAGYATAVAAAIAATGDASQIPADVTNDLEMSYAGAQAVAAQFPQYATAITAAAREAFLAGDQYAYTAGIIAVLIGAALVVFIFPRRDEESHLLAEYHAEDVRASAQTPKPTPGASAISSG